MTGECQADRCSDASSPARAGHDRNTIAQVKRHSMGLRHIIGLQTCEVSVGRDGTPYSSNPMRINLRGVREKEAFVSHPEATKDL